MNITLMRLKPLISELRLLRSEISRLADLKELELQSVHHLTTRTTPASPTDLQFTQVSYTDPEYSEIVRMIELRSGRPLSDEESGKVLELLSEDHDA